MRISNCNGHSSATEVRVVFFKDYLKVTTKVSKKRLSFNVGLWKFVPEQLEIFEHEYFLLQRFPKCFWSGRKNDFPSTSTVEA